MNRPFRIILIQSLFVCAGLGITLSAQTPTPTPPQEDAGPTKIFEVRLPVTVTQKKELITGLSRNDFLVFEDGVQQEVTFFSDEKTNPPVFVGVLMDTSSSTAGDEPSACVACR